MYESLYMATFRSMIVFGMSMCVCVCLFEGSCSTQFKHSRNQHHSNDWMNEWKRARGNGIDLVVCPLLLPLDLYFHLSFFLSILFLRFCGIAQQHVALQFWFYENLLLSILFCAVLFQHLSHFPFRFCWKHFLWAEMLFYYDIMLWCLYGVFVVVVVSFAVEYCDRTNV